MNLFSYHRAALLALLAAAPSLHAASVPGPWAAAFAIEAPPSAPVFVLELTPEVYATLSRSDLGDLAMVDAQGQPVAFAIERLPEPAAEAPDVRPVAAPIPVRTEGRAGAVDLALHVRRAADGSIETFDLQSRNVANGPGVEWLVDLGEAARDGIDGLRLVVDPGITDLRLRVDVHASDDLVAWRPVAAGLPILRAREGETMIERLDLALPRTVARYLALTPRGGALPASLRLSALRHRLPAPSATRYFLIEASGGSNEAPEYALPGRLPVHDVALTWDEGEGPAVRTFRIEQHAANGWRAVAGGTAWRFAIEGDVLRSRPVPADFSAEGPLRLSLAPSADRAPRLVLGYRPHRLVVLASGEPPFKLLAGSAVAGGRPASIAEALDAVRSRHPAGWTPPEARLGRPEVMAGAAALVAPIDPGRIVLWLVLGLGVVIVGGMAWYLLRSPLADQRTPPPA